jgi:hypothetical protein
MVRLPFFLAVFVDLTAIACIFPLNPPDDAMGKPSVPFLNVD